VLWLAELRGAAPVHFESQEKQLWNAELQFLCLRTNIVLRKTTSNNISLPTNLSSTDSRALEVRIKMDGFRFHLLNPTLEYKSKKEG